MPQIEHMSDLDFRLMSAFMAVEDFVHPILDKRIATFGLRENMIVVDYGCGPGRYTTRYAKIVGTKGKVFAVDVQPLALETVKRKAEMQKLHNIEAFLARGYHSGLPGHFADLVCALDIFFGLGDPTAFLKELHRITKPNGFLIIDDSHQSRRESLRKIKAAGCWVINEESSDHLKLLPMS
jgi:ubiquinone/menaquinone biosynthesis C-methylase UbiE